MFNRHKIIPKLNYDSDTTGYYSSSSQSDSPLSRSQFILRPSSGASSIYHIESPCLLTDYYEESSCRSSALSNVFTIEESYCKEESADPNFADADDELSTAALPVARSEAPKLKDHPGMKLLAGKVGQKPLRRHSILLRLETDTLKTTKPQYNSLRRIKEKVTNSVRNFKSESPKPRLFEKREKLYTTRSSSATSNFITAYSEIPGGTIYEKDDGAPPGSCGKYSSLGYSNNLPARTRSSSQMSGSHYCQTIYLPSFVPELLTENLEANRVELSLENLALSSELASLETKEEHHEQEDHGSFSGSEDHFTTKKLDFSEKSGKTSDFRSDKRRESTEEVKLVLERAECPLTKDKKVEPQPLQLDSFKDEGTRLIKTLYETQPRYENVPCVIIHERASDTNTDNTDTASSVSEPKSLSRELKEDVQLVEEYAEPDSPTTISSSFLNDSDEENLEQLFDEVELMQQIEKKLSIRPSTSTESAQTLRRNKVFIKEPDQDCKIYFEEKLKSFKRIANKGPSPKSILKKNPAPCHIYEEIQNDYLEPYPCDIRPSPPHRPAVVPNNIFQPCTTFSTNMFKCGRYPAILRKKKLPSLHLFSTIGRST